MPRTQIAIQRSFAMGEVAPSVYARADLANYHAALRTCRNFIVRRQGGVMNRPGFQFIRARKPFAPGNSVLHAFVFAAAADSYAVECGEEYFRFFQFGQPVIVSSAPAWSALTAYVPGDLVEVAGLHYYCILAHTNHTPPNATYWYPQPQEGGASIFEVPTPYVAGRFNEPAPLCWSQSGLVVTLTHLDEPPLELVYSGKVANGIGGTNPHFALRAITTAPTQEAPAVTGSSGSVAGTGNRKYVITSVNNQPPFEESLQGGDYLFLNVADPTPGAPIQLTFAAAPNAGEYRVYLDVDLNGVFGYVGTTKELFFNDIGLAPDYFRTPPQARVLFDSTNNYPAVNCTYQQRRIFAGTHNDREDVFASRIGMPSNFSIRSPLQDDDAVTWNMAAKLIQPVVALIPLAPLVILTDSGEWIAHGDESGVITPTGINLEQTGAVGAGFLEPIVIGDRVIYEQARASRLRDLQWTSRGAMVGLGSRDLTWLWSHFFDAAVLMSMAYAHEPNSCIWVVKDEGTLLGCTYIPEDDTWGWHRHDTGTDEGDEFVSVTVIPEGSEDRVYAIVRRTVDGNQELYVEWMASRQVGPNDAGISWNFLDCSTLYSGAAITTLDGLDHLEGRPVYVWTGAAVQGPFTVTGGEITLTSAITQAWVGLAIEADLETLDIDAANSDIRGKRTIVKAVQLLLDRSCRTFQVGPDSAHLTAIRLEPWDTSSADVDFSGIAELNITTMFRESGRVFLRHARPTPLSINAILPNFERS